MLELHGQTAIVTGGAQGIGEGIAKRLARAGATVVVADLNLERAETVAAQLGGDAFACFTDVTDFASVQNTTAEVFKRFGRIDALVNNAGIAGRSAPVWEQTSEDWKKIFDINVSGIFHFCRVNAVSPEIAAVVHFLVSPDCSFVTGQCYDVSGGRATY